MLFWRDWCLEKHKYKSLNAKNRTSDEKENQIYERYKNAVMSHGRHIFARAYDMKKDTVCAYPQYDNALTQ